MSQLNCAKHNKKLRTNSKCLPAIVPTGNEDNNAYTCGRSSQTQTQVSTCIVAQQCIHVPNLQRHPDVANQRNRKCCPTHKTRCANSPTGSARQTRSFSGCFVMHSDVWVTSTHRSISVEAHVQLLFSGDRADRQRKQQCIHVLN